MMTGTQDLKRGMILTAGPSVTSTEVDLVLEAVTQGWNARHSEFIKEFQCEFAKYIDVKYAMCTSSCTGALHLAFASLGLKAGDEVLIPENTWVASGVAPTYVGAKPVFVDIEQDTWCMSPESVLKHITPRTKAIVPVHLYGHPCDMDKIMEIARQYKMLVIEDAAPSVGAQWKGRRTGSFGDISAFSFQGAKIMVSGEGGMFCTNDEKVYKKAQYLNDYAVDTNKSFWIDEVGFKYRMSNLQAAMGIGQLRRVEELVERKRQIFKWYEERLRECSEFYLTTERPNARNIYWMSSLVFNEDAKIDREQFRAQLKEKMVDSRPFFFPMSSLPVFENQSKSNPVAYSIAKRGMNLPSGHNLRETDIDYVCEAIHSVLGKRFSRSSRIMQQPTSILMTLKNQAAKKPLNSVENQKFFLVPVTYQSVKDENLISDYTNWRNEQLKIFKDETLTTKISTENWLLKNVLDNKDRILFEVANEAGERKGFLGLQNIALDETSCELDALVGPHLLNEEDRRNFILLLLNWIRTELKIHTVYFRVFDDCGDLIRLYESIGFKEIQRVPVKKCKQNSQTEWKEVVSDPFRKVSRYLVTYQRV